MKRITTFDQFKSLPDKMKISRIRNGESRHFYMAGVHPMTNAVMLISGGNVETMETLHKHRFNGDTERDIWLCHKDNSDYDSTMSGAYMMKQLYGNLCSVDSIYMNRKQRIAPEQPVEFDLTKVHLSDLCAIIKEFVEEEDGLPENSVYECLYDDVGPELKHTSLERHLSVISSVAYAIVQRIQGVIKE